jgi:hypothetical protein
MFKDKKCVPGKGCAVAGIGLFIFGLVKYLGYEWDVAFMVLGILAIIWGILAYSMHK